MDTGGRNRERGVRDVQIGVAGIVARHWALSTFVVYPDIRKASDQSPKTVSIVFVGKKSFDHDSL